MKRSIIIVFVILLISAASFAQKDTTKAKYYFSADLSSKFFNFFSLKKGYEQRVILPISLKIMCSYQNFKFGLGLLQFNNYGSGDYYEWPIITQYYLGTDYYFINNKMLLLGLRLEAGGYFELRAMYNRYSLHKEGFFGRIGIIEEIKLFHNLSLILGNNIEYYDGLNSYLVWQGGVAHIKDRPWKSSINVGFRVNLFPSNKSFHSKDTASIKRLHYGISLGIINNLTKRDINYPYLPNIIHHGVGNDEVTNSEKYYRNAFVFIDRAAPSLEFHIRTMNYNFYMLGIDYTKFKRTTSGLGYDECGTGVINLSDLGVYFQYSHPLLQFFRKGNPLAFLYSGINIKGCKKNLIYTIKERSGAMQNKSVEFNDKSFLGYINLPIGIYFQSSRFYFDMGMNLSTFAFLSDKNSFKYSLTDFNCPIINQNIDVQYNSTKNLTIDKLWKEGYFTKDFFFKIGCEF
jgi:hypothetical protein